MAANEASAYVCVTASYLQVEDIVDTGGTLKALISTLHQQGVASVKVVTLLNKQARRKVNIQADYVGFEVQYICKCAKAGLALTLALASPIHPMTI